MYKQICKTLAVISLFAMLAAPVFQAQSDALEANIPFEFNVGKAVLPSGVYRIKPMNPSTLRIQSQDGHRGAIALIIGVSSSKEGDAGKLVFNRYGSQYFLSKVWRPGSHDGQELLKSRIEIEMAKNISRPEATTVAVKTP
jgi:hypothetical protein